MQNIEIFTNHYTPGKSYAEPTSEIIQKYKEIFPEFLMRLWQDDGFTHYGEGFLWTVNPEEFIEPLQWFLGDSEIGHAIIRTAFGGIIFHYRNNYHYLSPISLEIFELVNRLDMIMNYDLCESRSLKEAYFYDIYQKAFNRLGIPASNECYAFVPAIPLGGKVDAKNIQKVKLKEHLLLLSQV